MKTFIDLPELHSPKQHPRTIICLLSWMKVWGYTLFSLTKSDSIKPDPDFNVFCLKPVYTGLSLNLKNWLLVCMHKPRVLQHCPAKFSSNFSVFFSIIWKLWAGVFDQGWIISQSSWLKNKVEYTAPSIHFTKPQGCWSPFQSHPGWMASLSQV